MRIAISLFVAGGIAVLVCRGHALAQPQTHSLQPPTPKLKPAGQTDPKVENVRAILNAYARSSLAPADKRIEIRRPLIEMGEELFPIFETILADSGSKPETLIGAFQILIAMKDANRVRFVDQTVLRLADSSWQVRWKALVLLGMIGGPSDTAPVVALLSDDKVGYHAADTLVEIGGRRDVVAMDVWLKSFAGMGDEQKRHRDYVQHSRDKLAQRLRDVPRTKELKN